MALAVAVTDWALKGGAIATGQPFSFHWFYERQTSWLSILIAVVSVGGMIAVSRSRLSMVGLGLFLGGALGNVGELAAFGHVTNFIPFPPGWLSAPADLFALSGYALFSAGAFWGIWRDRRRARQKRVAEA